MINQHNRISHAAAIKHAQESRGRIDATLAEEVRRDAVSNEGVDVDAIRMDMQFQPLFIELQRENDVLKAEIDILKAKNEALEQVVTFYADPETYHAVAFFFDPPTGGFDDDFDQQHGHPDYDRPMPGRRAREVLKGKT